MFDKQVAKLADVNNLYDVQGVTSTMMSYCSPEII